MFLSEREKGMNFLRLTAVVLAVILCAAASSCSDKDVLSKQENSKTEVSDNISETTSEPTEPIEYDPAGSVRLYDSLKEKYENNFRLLCDMGTIRYEFAIKGELMYMSATAKQETTVILHSKDKKTYKFQPRAKEYSVSDDDFNIKDGDPLFGATADFISAEKNDKGATYDETYRIDESVSGNPGTITYKFSATTGELKAYSIKFEGADDTIDYNVKELSQPTDRMFDIPDFSEYKLVK